MVLSMKNNPVIFICLSIVLLSNNNLFAQLKPLVDTAISIQPSSNRQKVHRSDEDTTYTSLNDTIQKFRRSSEFAYMNDLDSLLRTAYHLKNNSIKPDDRTGRIIRKTKERNDLSAINKILNSAPLQVFFWVLAFLFVVFISYRLLSNYAISKRRKSYLAEQTDDDYAKELDSVSRYDTLIVEAENKPDYNLAVRYAFLKTLKNLANKELIIFDPSKTNKRYIEEFKANNGTEEFESLVYNYEYVWYGKFSITISTYERLKDKFQFFNQKYNAN